MILGFIGLLAASFRPYAWWRQLAVYLGLTSLAELYLSFLLLYHSAQTALLAEYNAIPPYTGTSTLRATVIGIDLNYYSSPLVTASLGSPFYLGFLCFALVGGRMILKTVQNMRSSQLLGGALGIFGGTGAGPSIGLDEVYMSPPYQHVWVSSEDKELNPLSTDPDTLTDDQLLVSFEKLYNAVHPGGIVDIILPAWATQIGDRLHKLAPNVGFTVEKSDIIYRTQGRPETEIRLARPAPQSTAIPTESIEEAQQTMNEQVDARRPVLPPSAIEFEQPPVRETTVEPAWTHVNTTPLERAILTAAINIISAHGEPVPYRELLNQAYLDLVDRKIEFDSARQIETTLLNHSGSEVIIVEVKDESSGRLTKKWWLGETRISTNKKPSLAFLGEISKRARRSPITVHTLLRKWERKPRYKTKRKSDEE